MYDIFINMDICIKELFFLLAETKIDIQLLQKRI